MGNACFPWLNPALPGSYLEPVLDEDVIEVRLSVYTLKFSNVALLDSVSANVVGAYHTAIVIRGLEWAYGGHDEKGLSGVYHCHPEENPEFVFYRRVILGRVRATDEALRSVVSLLEHSVEWEGNRYDLVEHNCNHFSASLCWRLLQRLPPRWVNKTAEILAVRRRKERAEAVALRTAMTKHFRRDLSEVLQEVNLEGASSAKAFQSAFEKTFNEAWDSGYPRLVVPHSNHNYDDLVDTNIPVDLQYSNVDEPFAAQRKAEERLSQLAGQAAAKAARKAANSFDLGAPTFQKLAAEGLSPESLERWDQVWRRESRELLNRWRRDAVAEAMTGLNKSSKERILLEDEDDYITMITDALGRAEDAARRVAA
mmetsp:Transcript_36083/g.82873  ORF Transcript_36083/g.82873 Transcript_36083/m.82873 type:complete len:369 (-) Transcript_36083:40-1146(-)